MSEVRVPLSNRRELVLTLEPGKADRWQLSRVQDHGTHKMTAGGISNLTRAETFELFLALDGMMSVVDRDGLPGAES